MMRIISFCFHIVLTMPVTSSLGETVEKSHYVSNGVVENQKRMPENVTSLDADQLDMNGLMKMKTPGINVCLPERGE